MEEKSLLKISLGVSFLGILGLYFFSLGVELDNLGDFEELNGFEEEEVIKVEGVVGRVVEKEKVMFIEVLDEKVEKVPVVLFDSGIEVSKGDFVSVTGTVEDYLGEKEVIASRIELK